MITPNLSAAASISGIRLSSVVPAEATAAKEDRNLTNLDLALKLHYIRGVYFFTAEAVQGLTIYDLKKPMFPWLSRYHTVSGRIRKSENGGGRPFIKCNDGGVRIVEAHCDKTIEEFVIAENYDDCSRLLVHDQVLGPDLGYSPLAYVQFTWFKCGGMSVGISWAHVLGDPFSASNFINAWAQLMNGQELSNSLHVPHTNKPELLTLRKPFSIKRVDPVGDCWTTTIANNCKMETHVFHFTSNQLDNIESNISNPAQPIKLSKFEIISAVIWKSLSKVRGDSGPTMVTICARNSNSYNNSSKEELPSNKLEFNIVRADFSPAKGDVHELATLIAEKKEKENSSIEAEVEADADGKIHDYIAYGTNLTFVNLEEADIYGLELKGNKPIFAYYTMKGVGEEGTILALPGPENGHDVRGDGRIVTVILPENQLTELKNELFKEWNVA